MAPARTTVKAWQPSVPGVTEVFHAHFVDHAYPMHTHDSWDLMLLDQGTVRFKLDRHDLGNGQPTRVILLPPTVPHDGRTVDAAGFRKRVVYLDTTVLPAVLIGPAISAPMHVDALLRDRLSAFHDCLARGDSDLEAESRLAFIRERLLRRLGSEARTPTVMPTASSNRLAHGLREIIDARIETGLTLVEAAEHLQAEPSHLVRTFSRVFGLPPHRYLTSRRIERARRLLLAGVPIAEAATAVGFFDQAHLHRHFRRFLDVSPGAYVRQGQPSPQSSRPLP